MKQSQYKPNEITYKILIARSPDFKEANVFFKEMKKSQCQLDEATYSILIRKSPDFEEAKFFLEEMRQKNIQTSKRTVGHLIRKATKSIHIREICRVIKHGAQEVNLTKSFIVLMHKINDCGLNNREERHSIALHVDAQMDDLKVNHRSQTLTPLLENFGTLEEAWRFYKYLKKKKRIASVQPGLFNCLIRKADCYTEASKIYEHMKKEEICPTVATLQALMSKIERFDQGWKHIVNVESLTELPYEGQNDIALTEIFKTLYRKAKSDEEIEKIRKKVNQHCPHLRNFILSRNCIIKDDNRWQIVDANRKWSNL